jgi:hypothetical protein
MAHDDLLVTLQRRATDTSETSRNPPEVSEKPAPTLACTFDTPDTPRNDHIENVTRAACTINAQRERT